MKTLTNFAHAGVDILLEGFVATSLAAALSLGKLEHVIAASLFLFATAVMARRITRSDQRIITERSRVNRANELVPTASWAHFAWAAPLIAFGVMVVILGGVMSVVGWALIIVYGGFATLRAAMIIQRKRCSNFAS